VAESLEHLKSALEARLGKATGGNVRVRAIDALSGGACQDNYRVDLSFSAGELAGDRVMALRSDAPSSLPGSIDRQREFAVIEAAVAAGVKTPRARFLSRDLTRPGAWAYLLDWAEGTAIGRKVLRDPELAEARRKLPAELGKELARIHSVTRAKVGTLGLADPPDVLAFTRKMVETMHEPRPALFLALGWLEQNRPTKEEVVLVHGDFRTGNFMVTREGLSAVLDWEFSHWGSPGWDLSWIEMRNWRFGQNKLPIGGFGHRKEFYAAYEEASGRKVDPVNVHWWNVLSNVRWAAGCAHQGERYLSGRESDLELIAIPRRGVEMEYEALRLIEKGPVR